MRISHSYFRRPLNKHFFYFLLLFSLNSEQIKILKSKLTTTTGVELANEKVLCIIKENCLLTYLGSNGFISLSITNCQLLIRKNLRVAW